MNFKEEIKKLHKIEQQSPSDVFSFTGRFAQMMKMSSEDGELCCIHKHVFKIPYSEESIQYGFYKYFLIMTKQKIFPPFIPGANKFYFKIYDEDWNRIKYSPKIGKEILQLVKSLKKEDKEENEEKDGSVDLRQILKSMHHASKKD